MSNLSELFPSGGAAKEFEAVASGTLSSGQTVVLNTDGTVQAVAQESQSQALGSASVFQSGFSNYLSSAFDSDNNKVIVVYQDDNDSNDAGKAVVGTVSGTSISFGTPVVFDTGRVYSNSCAYDSSANKLVIVYRSNANSSYGTAIVGTVSGTSISFGAEVIFNSNRTDYFSATYDPSASKVVISFRHDNLAGKSIVGTVSGTSISFGTAVQFRSNCEHISSTFDSNSNKIVIAFQDHANSLGGSAVVGTVSGTSISFGSVSFFENNVTIDTSCAFDSASNKVVIAYGADDSGDKGKAIVATVSGTSVSFGGAYTFSSSQTRYHSVAFDSLANKVVVAYAQGVNGILKIFTVSGTNLSLYTTVTFLSVGGPNEPILVFDSFNNKVVISYTDFGSTPFGNGTSKVFQNAFTSTNFTDFIGITAEAISNTATGLVTPQGGVNASVSGLTTGLNYYVQDNGSLSTTFSSVPAGRALSSTSILLEG